ncbi:MAG: hypothetical protein AAFX00_06900, partial [Pseudomonadota bacterium]
SRHCRAAGTRSAGTMRPAALAKLVTMDGHCPDQARLAHPAALMKILAQMMQKGTMKEPRRSLEQRQTTRSCGKRRK